MRSCVRVTTEAATLPQTTTGLLGQLRRRGVAPYVPSWSDLPIDSSSCSSRREVARRNPHAKDPLGWSRSLRSTTTLSPGVSKQTRRVGSVTTHASPGPHPARRPCRNATTPASPLVPYPTRSFPPRFGGSKAGRRNGSVKATHESRSRRGLTPQADPERSANSASDRASTPLVRQFG